MASRSRMFTPTAWKREAVFVVLLCLANTELASEDSGLPPRQTSEKCFSGLYHRETSMSKTTARRPGEQRRSVTRPHRPWNPNKEINETIKWRIHLFLGFSEKSWCFSGSSPSFLLQRYSLFFPFVYFSPSSFFKYLYNFKHAEMENAIKMYWLRFSKRCLPFFGNYLSTRHVWSYCITVYRQSFNIKYFYRSTSCFFLCLRKKSTYRYFYDPQILEVQTQT